MNTLRNAELYGMFPYNKANARNVKVEVKASQAFLAAWHISNPDVDTAYVQIYDLAAADVTVGTTPAAYTIPVPGVDGNGDPGIAKDSLHWPVSLASGFTYAVTTTPTGSTDTGSDTNVSFMYR